MYQKQTFTLRSPDRYTAPAARVALGYTCAMRRRRPAAARPRRPSGPAVAAALVAVAGCAAEPAPFVPPVLPPDAPPPVDAEDVDQQGVPGEGQLSARAWLVRASLDLRGVRPSAGELEQVAADPAAADALVMSFLDDPRLPTRAAWLYDEAVETAVWFQGSPTRGFADASAAEQFAAGWAPLAHVEALVREGHPWTWLVTAPHLYLNADAAAFWGVSAPGEGWAPWTPPEGRPMAGLLSSDALWMVHDGDRTNFHRRRAAAVSRIFLCHDFLERDVRIELDLDASALATMETALRTEPACTTCHAALDPLAAYFGGFPERSVPQDRDQLVVYSEPDAEWTRGWRTPGYFGHPGHDLVDLGAHLAADPRYARCAVQRFAAGLIGAELDAAGVDAAQIADWTDAFVDGGQLLPPLLGEIVRGDAYRRDDERVLQPHQLAAALQDALAWAPADDEDLDLLATSSVHRVLGGGTDDVMVVRPNREPGLGHHLLLAWAARRGAAEALQADRDRDPGARALFTVADPDASPDDATLAAQLVAWRIRFISDVASTDSEPVQRLAELYREVEAESGPDRAWEVALEALIRHPMGLIY